MDLSSYVKGVEDVKAVLDKSGNRNVCTHQTMTVNDAACFMTRQYFYSNLFDHLNMRPFLEPIEKRWITFQILSAMVRLCSVVAVSCLETLTLVHPL